MPLRRRRIIGPSFPYLAVPTVAGGGGPPADYTTGLAAHWPMDDAHVSGTVVQELINGATYAGAATGGVSSAAGPVASTTARALDGVNGTYIQWATGDNGPVDWNASPFTLAGWVYRATGGSGWCCSFSRDSSNTKGVLFVADTSGIIAIVNSTRWDASSSSYSPNDTWVHLCLTCSAGGGGTFKIYVNGSSKTLSSSSAFGPGNAISMLGAFQVGNGSCLGRLYDWRIYNRELSATDVLGLYNSY